MWKPPSNGNKHNDDAHPLATVLCFVVVTCIIGHMVMYTHARSIIVDIKECECGADLSHNDVTDATFVIMWASLNKTWPGLASMVWDNVLSQTSVTLLMIRLRHPVIHHLSYLLSVEHGGDDPLTCLQYCALDGVTGRQTCPAMS